jgi:hypothetical protein
MAIFAGLLRLMIDVRSRIVFAGVGIVRVRARGIAIRIKGGSGWQGTLLPFGGRGQ